MKKRKTEKEMVGYTIENAMRRAAGVCVGNVENRNKWRTSGGRTQIGRRKAKEKKKKNRNFRKTKS